ncbi:hypothetical protein [Protaetiibacter mangrovi]|uniref:Uncharacterized protein n=1 Tax=Protaetiibacter mangrovi TaxID=2970926 RepID=A0ABT1ZBR7_9MICO|nr:hypothetical protein [Protaetiibacter mangrovi]MCS0498147.1 hypothetical protein [Protaetiibacter mangrovi]TPX05685.1 hypothetical protein FJ656_05195 [Schumannella luteola]
MDLTPDSRIWISDTRDAELALAAERARRALERAGDGARAARVPLLSRLRRRAGAPQRAVTHPVTH